MVTSLRNNCYFRIAMPLNIDQLMRWSQIIDKMKVRGEAVITYSRMRLMQALNISALINFVNSSFRIVQLPFIK
jgi:hypothetical protein